MKRDDVEALRQRLARVEEKLAALAGKNDAKSLRARESLSLEWDNLRSSLRGRRKSKRP